MNGTGTRRRLLVFILTYEAANHIEHVVARLPGDLEPDFDVEVLCIDDASTDGTPDVARRALGSAEQPYAWTLLVNPVNQGYGGNQKLGYRYAIDNGFDVVVMLHGDGQYPPEQIAPLARLADERGAAFGSRFADPGRARAGGMPTYKFVGNRILTTVQNRLLGTSLTEFHSGFRAYRTDVLSSIPFELNSNDFHFDTEIFIQCVRAGIEIGEMPIPTRYADEECRVNGISYAANVVSQTMRASLHEKGLFYERKYDTGSRAGLYESKIDFTSPAQLMLGRVPAGSTVLDLGSSDGHVARVLRQRGCRVIGVDLEMPASTDSFDEFHAWNLDDGLPPLEGDIEVVMLADVVEHLRSPEQFAADLAAFCAAHRTRQVLVSTGNVAFIVQRTMLLLGQFNYGPRGILDMTHTRLFTFGSISRLFRQAGFRVREIVGVPAPFPLAVGRGLAGRALLRANELAIRISRRMFSYQVFVALEPPVNLRRLLADSATPRASSHDSAHGGPVGNGDRPGRSASVPASRAR